MQDGRWKALRNPTAATVIHTCIHSTYHIATSDHLIYTDKSTHNDESSESSSCQDSRAEVTLNSRYRSYHAIIALSQASSNAATDRQPGKLKVTEHFFDVPKDYHNPTSGTIRLFARSVRKHETPIEPSEDAAKKPDLPWMVYLNGGPGHPCRPPNAYPWTQTILDRGYQMLYLDQRGTGLSTPVTATTLGLRGYNETQAKYLKLYRADSIVRDCEAIRLALTSTSPPYTTKSSSSATSTSTSTSTGAAAAAAHGEPEGRKWSIMGQSFGGFCAITYLSFYPSSLREAFLFGGLQPLVTSPDAVYRSLYKKVIERNNAYYAKFPEDVARVQSIVAYLRRFGDGAIKLPSEGALTARRFQQLGINLGFHGGVDVVHDIVLRASVDIEMFGHLTRGTQSAIDRATGFDDALIYSILHEQIYCVGEAARWSAERARKEFAEFEIREGERVFFTGEMVS